jgi:hypothetical protein
MLGNFLKDERGELVTMEGAPILQKQMMKGAKKPRACQGCSFRKWCIGDTCFIVSTKIPGELNWLCPNCAVKRGLPEVHHRKNRFVKQPLAAGERGIILPAMYRNVKQISMTWSDLTSGYFCPCQGTATAPATVHTAHRSSIKRS